MLKSFLAIISGLCISSTYAQADFEFTPSGEYLNEGYNRLVRGENEMAVFYFNKIHRSDTNFMVAQFNTVIAHYNNGKNEALEEVALEAIDDENSFSDVIYYWYIESLIKTKNYDKAQKIIEEGKKAFPLYSRYDRQRIKIQIEKGELEKAVSALQAYLKMHPQDSEAHYELAHIMAGRGAIAEALIGYNFSVISNRSSMVLQQAYAEMEDVMNNNYEVTDKRDQNKNFQSIYQMIQSEIALKRAYQTGLDLNYTVERQTHIMLESFQYKEGTNDFWMDYYGKYLQSVKRNGHNNAYILYLLSVMSLPNINEAIKKNEYAIRAFEDFHNEYWTRYQNDHFKPKVGGESFETNMNYDANGVLKSTGNRNHMRNEEGRWVYWRTDGTKEADIHFKNGVLHGKCSWYDEFEKVYEFSDFKDGAQSGLSYFSHKNKTMWYEANIKDGEIDGLVTVADDYGVKMEEKTLKNGFLVGEYKSFFPNGQVKLKCNYVDGKIQGEMIEYFANGSVYSKVDFVDDLRNGDYISYYPNGKTMLEGKYEDGKQVGIWNEYFYNGKLLGVSPFNKKGELEGRYYEFTLKGDSNLVTDYVGNQKHGLSVQYGSGNQKLWVEQFKKGTLKKLMVYNPEGELIHNSKKEYNLYDRFGYKYTEGKMKKGALVGPYHIFYKGGNMASETFYENGIRNGKHTEYYEFGGVQLEEFYKDGLEHGKGVYYFNNGKVKSEGNFLKGLKIGEWKYYHPNGNLKSVEYFSNGVSNGFLTEYNIDGIKVREFKLVDGLTIRSDVFDYEGNRIQRVCSPRGDRKETLKHSAGFDYVHGELKAGGKNGNYQFLYPNGTVIEESEESNGLSVGKFRTYYEDGSLHRTGQYDGHSATGIWKDFYRDSTLRTLYEYKHGEVRDSVTHYYHNGKRESLIYYNALGEEISRTEFHSNGIKSDEYPYLGDFIHGELKVYGETGELSIIRKYNGGIPVAYSYLKDGKQLPYIKLNLTDSMVAYYNNGNKSAEYHIKDGYYHGKYLRYYTNGKPWLVKEYLNDEIHGKFIAYYPNGNFSVKGHYDNGRRNGVFEEFYENGILRSSKTYVQDILHGECKIYNKEGKLIRTITYNDNVVIDIK